MENIKLLPAPRAGLIGFHRYNADIGQWTSNTAMRREQMKIDYYRDYLCSIGRLCEDKPGGYLFNGPFSHWSDMAHYAKWHVDNADLQMRLQAQKKVKVKKPNIREWLKAHHPEILKEFNKKGGDNGKST